MLAVYLVSFREPFASSSPLDVAMGRKGGGKKVFLRGVVAKPDADDGIEQQSTESAVPLPQPSTSETASERPDTSSTGLQLPDIRSTTEDVSSETRGQLTQRHKKVNPCAVLESKYEILKIINPQPHLCMPCRKQRC